VKIKKEDWYGLNHEKVREKFEGNPVFLNYFCVKGNYQPSAVYHSLNPNREKGHKDYMLLTKFDEQWYVSGMSEKEMQKERYQDGILCLSCNTVLYSVNRHHFHKCGCENETFVDGGKDYMRYGAMDISKTEIVKLDLVSNEVLNRKTMKLLYKEKKKKNVT
jgi:hypothetical protein